MTEDFDDYPIWLPPGKERKASAKVVILGTMFGNNTEEQDNGPKCSERQQQHSPKC